MDFHLFIGLGTSRDVVDAEVLQLFDCPNEGTTDSITDTSLGVVLFNDKDTASNGLDVGAETFDVEGLETEDVEDADVEAWVKGKVPSAVSSWAALRA